MKLRTQITLVTGLTLMIAATLFGVVTFRAKKRALLSGMDNKLMAIAQLAKEILPADYHDKIKGADSVSDAEYLRIVSRWDRLCRQLGLEYIWSLMLIDGKTVFTSGSSTSKNVSNKDFARFFEPHSNPEFYETALLAQKPQYRINDDKWGRIKVVLLPFKNAHGQPYLFGASMKMEEVNTLLRRSVWQSIEISLGILLLGLLINVVLAGSLVRPLEKLTNLTKSISEGNWGHIVETSGASEIRSLGHNVNEMSKAIHEKITEQKRVEQALRKSETLNRRLVEHLPHRVFIKDRNSVYVSCNANYARDRGVTPEEIVGKDDFAFHPAELAESFRADDRAVIETGEMTELEERHFVAGQERWAHTTKVAYRDEQGNITGVLGVFEDITERRRAEFELQKMQKLQSVGTLAGGIAHDFNNILLGLFGNISLAKGELAKDHPGYALLEESEKSMNRAVRLTKQLLTFAKGGEPVKDAVSLGELVDEVARFDLSGSRVSLDCRQVDNLWPAVVDKGQIQQVISNLVINARQAMPAGGCLHIALTNATLSAEAVHGLRQGNYVKVTVQDEGGGIEPKHLDRIFDPYFTTKQSGSGLGLATAWSIITKHGGQIGVDSVLGKGTTFTLYLPASDSPPAAETKPPSTKGPSQFRPARILVMDDEDTIRRLAVRMLTSCGYSLATAPGGQEAVEMYKQALEAGEPFDAVIMDMTIPGGVGGVDAIKSLLMIDPHVKAIVSSGYVGDPVMANFADYGFKGIAAKPYTVNELRAVVAQILG